MRLGNTFQMLQKHHPRGLAQCPGRIHPKTLALPPGKSSSCSQHLWPRVLLIPSNEKHNTSLNPGEQGAFSFSCSYKFQLPSLTPEHEATHTQLPTCPLPHPLPGGLVKLRRDLRWAEVLDTGSLIIAWWGSIGSNQPSGHFHLKRKQGPRHGKRFSVVSIQSQKNLGPDLPDVSLTSADFNFS